MGYLVYQEGCVKKKNNPQLPAANLLTGPLICSVFYSVSNKSGYCFVHITMELFPENIFSLKIPMQAL